MGQFCGENRLFWMPNSHVTSSFLNNRKFSHTKLLSYKRTDNVNCDLLYEMKINQELDLTNFEFNEVTYLLKTIYSELVVFAKSTIFLRQAINIVGFLRKLSKNEATHISKFSIKKTNCDNLLLGPVSFVNSSYVPNATHQHRDGKKLL